MGINLAAPVVQIELPTVLLKRADLQTVSSARELITFLLEKYAQELEQSRRRQAYVAYYATRSPEEESEELSLLADFAVADVAIEEDWTEEGIATDLLQAGVPNEDIVLAFQPPEMRPYTEFATA